MLLNDYAVCGRYVDNAYTLVCTKYMSDHTDNKLAFYLKIKTNQQ